MSAMRRTKLFLCALIALSQRYKNPGRHVGMASKFCAVAPNICGSSVLNMFRVTILAPQDFEMDPALQAGRSQVRFPMVSLKCSIDVIILAALRPRGRLSL